MQMAELMPERDAGHADVAFPAIKSKTLFS